MSANWLYHITTETEAVTAQHSGEYVPQGFVREGFIHCSHPHQVAAVANRIFRGQRNLVVLKIDATKVGCAIVEENLEGGSELYPHIYGRLPISAVAAVLPFHCDEAGIFTFSG
jgi:uncharacterized protein (DUF952 family)